MSRQELSQGLSDAATTQSRGVDAKEVYTKIAVIRIKGLADTSPEVEKALDLLRLRRRYTCVIIDDRSSYMGMLKTVKDWVTWGEINADTLAELLLKRGRLVGDKPLTEDWIRKYGWSSIREFALAYIMGEVSSLSCPEDKPWPRSGDKVLCIPQLKPFFRLHPPSGGLRSTKKNFDDGGDLGYRGILINELIMRMI